MEPRSPRAAPRSPRPLTCAPRVRCPAPRDARRGMLRAARTKSRKWLQQVHFRGSGSAGPSARRGGGGSPGPAAGRGWSGAGGSSPSGAGDARRGRGSAPARGREAAPGWRQRGAGGSRRGGEGRQHPRGTEGRGQGAAAAAPPELDGFGSLRKQERDGILHLVAAAAGLAGSRVFSPSAPRRTIDRRHLPS